LRIGLLTDGYRPGTNGVIRFVSLHRRALEELGHKVFVFTWGRRNAEDDSGVVRSPGIPFIKPGYHVALGYSHRAHDVLRTLDILHTNQPLLSGALALRYKKRYNLPVVLTCHTRYDLLGVTRFPFIPLSLYRRAVRPYLQRCTDRCDLVMAPSPEAVRVMRDLGVTCPIEIVPYGVDLDRYREPQRRLSRGDIGVPDAVPLALFVGRLAPEKNLEFVLRALARPELESAYLLIVGGGSERGRLEATARELGLDGRVRFVGQAPSADLPAYAALADHFVTASQIEMLPISILEALAAGLPILGLDVPWIRHVVRDGTNGLLAEPDPGAFARVWATLVENRSLQARLADGARAASEEYDVRRTTALMVAHYQRLVEQYGRRADG